MNNKFQEIFINNFVYLEGSMPRVASFLFFLIAKNKQKRKLFKCTFYKMYNYVQ